MAAILGAGYLNPQSSPNDGRAVVITDTATISANPTAADTVEFKIPAGFQVCKIWIRPSDMDTNVSPEMTAKIGYLKMSGSSATEDDDYFMADGAFGQAAGIVDLDFAPITFQEDMRLAVTWTVDAATFAAGTIRVVMLGNSVGPR